MSEQEKSYTRQISQQLEQEMKNLNIGFSFENLRQIMFREIPGIGLYIRVFYQSSRMNFVATSFVASKSLKVKLISIEQLPSSQEESTKKINGCEVQIGNYCYDCFDGFVRVNHKCYAGKNAEMVIKQTIGK